MAKYAIIPKEILSRTVIVEAENVEEAIQKVEDAMDNGDISLDYHDDSFEREVVPSEYFGDGTVEVGDDEDVSYYWHLDSDKE